MRAPAAKTYVVVLRDLNLPKIALLEMFNLFSEGDRLLELVAASREDLLEYSKYMRIVKGLARESIDHRRYVHLPCRIERR